MKARSFSKIDWIAYGFIGPAVLLFGIAVVYPVIQNIVISFYSWGGFGPMKPVGLQNYSKLFHDANFINSLKLSIIWTVATTVITVALGLLIAVLCGLTHRNTTLFRMIIFAPMSISAVAGGMIWSMMFQPEFGFVNAMLRGLGLDFLARPWLGSPGFALMCVIIAYVWSQTGFSMVILYGAIRAVPTVLYEASYIDGANSWQLFRWIMLPMSAHALKFAVFMTLLSSLKVFDLIFAMTQGGPMRSTEIIGYFMYTESFKHFKLGYGAASVVILFIFVYLIALPILRERSEEML